MSYKIEWKDCYQFLEDLRQSGVVNMYGASPMLNTFIAHTYEENAPTASAVLASWINNYDELLEDGVIRCE